MIKRFLKVVMGTILMILIGIVYLQWYRLTGIGIPCMFRKITHLYCPGCGVTRMCIYLSRLDFYHAFRSNPLIMIIAPILLIIMIRYARSYILYNKKYLLKREVCIVYVMLISLLIFGVLRNIPYFYYLRPIS